MLETWADRTIEFVSQVVEAPNWVRRRSLFLGGGITNTADWQSEVIRELRNLPIIIYNPRRKNFDVSNPLDSVKQIEWEYRHLRTCDDLLFYFPETSICPIALFELGAHLMTAGKKIFVGIHPDYPRMLDVEVQTGLIRPDIDIAYGLTELISQVLSYYSP